MEIHYKCTIWGRIEIDESKITKEEVLGELPTHAKAMNGFYGTFYKPLHLYITSNEEPSNGDYCIDGDDIYGPFEEGDIAVDCFKKIVLTTDPRLIQDGVQAIDDEFLEWFCSKNTTCEEVEVENHVLEFGYNHYKIIISKEELKVSEEWQKQFPNIIVLDPDGWDRNNYQYSWFEEKITLTEYNARLYRSTIKGIIPKEEPKQEIIEDKIYQAIGLSANKQGIINQALATSKVMDILKKEIIVKQETLEEAAERYEETDFNTTPTEETSQMMIQRAFINGVKWQQERSYSEEEVKRLCSKAWLKIPNTPNMLEEFDKWFEQFKKNEK